MPPVSQHIPVSPFATTELNSERVVINGREYKVTKLASATVQDSIRQERKSRGTKGLPTLREYLRTVPAQVKADFRLGQKVTQMPQGAAERKVRAELEKRKQAAVRAEVGYLSKEIRRERAADLEVTHQDVESELERLRLIVSAVESSVRE